MTGMRTAITILAMLALASACGSTTGGATPAGSPAPSVKAAPLTTPVPSGHPDVDYYGY